jgi:hypothetical protein
MSWRFASVDILTNEETPVHCVRLIDGESYIEVTVKDGVLQVRSVGSHVGADTVIILPQSGNTVYITTDRERQAAVCREAEAKNEIRKTNEASRKKYGRNQ